MYIFCDLGLAVTVKYQSLFLIHLKEFLLVSVAADANKTGMGSPDHNKLENSERDAHTRPPDLPLEKPICRSGSNS